jgi:hypothetical protein
MRLMKCSLTVKRVVQISNITLLILGFLLPVTAGCRRQSALQQDYGRSWAYNEAVQIANPQAALVETPATGLAPNASRNAMEAYNKGFSGQKAGGGISTTVNLGGLTTAGGGGGN